MNYRHNPEAVRMRLSFLESEFSADGNPMWAWEALELWAGALRSCPPGTPIELPSFVVTYLSAAAAQLMTISPDTSGGLPSQVMAAVGLKSAAGRSRITEWRKKRDRIEREAARVRQAAASDEALLDQNKAIIDAWTGMMPSEKQDAKKYASRLYKGETLSTAELEELKRTADSDRKQRADGN
ncbi:MAG: hypothetical protein AB7G10_28430 [Reyranellaceae bacterium]